MYVNVSYIAIILYFCVILLPLCIYYRLIIMIITIIYMYACSLGVFGPPVFIPCPRPRPRAIRMRPWRRPRRGSRRPGARLGSARAARRRLRISQFGSDSLETKRKPAYCGSKGNQPVKPRESTGVPCSRRGFPGG